MKSKNTKILVSHDNLNENEYEVTTCENAQNMIFLSVEGMVNGKRETYDIEMLREDVPYLIDLLKEFVPCAY